MHAGRTMNRIIATTLLGLAAIMGCATDAGLPNELDVALSLTESQTVAANTGPAVMAGATWGIFRKADATAAKLNTTATADDSPLGPYGAFLNGGIVERPPVDARIFRVVMADDGRMVHVFDSNYFLPEIYGRAFSIGDVSETSLPGGTIESRSFGLSVGNRFGIAVFVRARLLGVRVADAVIYAWGTVTDGRADGTLGYQIDFTGGPFESLLTTGGDQYPMYGSRE